MQRGIALRSEALSGLRKEAEERRGRLEALERARPKLLRQLEGVEERQRAAREAAKLEAEALGRDVSDFHEAQVHISCALKGHLQEKKVSEYAKWMERGPFGVAFESILAGEEKAKANEAPSLWSWAMI